MNSLQIKGLVKIIVFTLLLALIAAVGQALFPGPWFHRHFWSMVLFFAILTGSTGVLATKLMKLETFNSVSVILGITVLRLLFSIGFVFIILWAGDENLLWFVVDFFIIYLLYLLFDMYSLITNLRLHSK
ncbi:hypothetical protein [Cyclobacterium jeungdonense]|uniref:ATP synthase protein I n=1 Tax=Cyclobacterium jeungdonense TaxID=708087 RepID=A0ABT8C5D1_9BACT|nr:hypothetical protein [Cyclobacterium jeungdonense]MDN3687969.1 hypothetical protein [Cyclobacterium jeungdonense]